MNIRQMIKQLQSSALRNFSNNVNGIVVSTFNPILEQSPLVEPVIEPETPPEELVLKSSVIRIIFKKFDDIIIPLSESIYLIDLFLTNPILTIINVWAKKAINDSYAEFGDSKLKSLSKASILPDSVYPKYSNLVPIKYVRQSKQFIAIYDSGKLDIINKSIQDLAYTCHIFTDKQKFKVVLKNNIYALESLYYETLLYETKGNNKTSLSKYDILRNSNKEVLLYLDKNEDAKYKSKKKVNKSTKVVIPTVNKLIEKNNTTLELNDKSKLYNFKVSPQFSDNNIQVPRTGASVFGCKTTNETGFILKAAAYDNYTAQINKDHSITCKDYLTHFKADELHLNTGKDKPTKDKRSLDITYDNLTCNQINAILFKQDTSFIKLDQKDLIFSGTKVGFGISGKNTITDEDFTTKIDKFKKEKNDINSILESYIGITSKNNKADLDNLKYKSIAKIDNTNNSLYLYIYNLQTTSLGISTELKTFEEYKSISDSVFEQVLTCVKYLQAGENDKALGSLPKIYDSYFNQPLSQYLYERCIYTLGQNPKSVEKYSSVDGQDNYYIVMKYIQTVNPTIYNDISKYLLKTKYINKFGKVIVNRTSNSAGSNYVSPEDANIIIYNYLLVKSLLINSFADKNESSLIEEQKAKVSIDVPYDISLLTILNDMLNNMKGVNSYIISGTTKSPSSGVPEQTLGLNIDITLNKIRQFLLW